LSHVDDLLTVAFAHVGLASTRGITQGKQMGTLRKRDLEARMEHIKAFIAYMTQEGTCLSDKTLDAFADAFGLDIRRRAQTIQIEKEYHDSKRRQERERQLGVGKTAVVRREERRERWVEEHPAAHIFPANCLPASIDAGYAVFVPFAQALQKVVKAHYRESWFDHTGVLVLAECSDGATA
jgi:hypothetical protein